MEDTVDKFDTDYTSLVCRYWNKFLFKLSGFHSEDMRRFIEDFLRPDGVLLLKFINEHVDARISRDLVNELIRIYSKQVQVICHKNSLILLLSNLLFHSKFILKSMKFESFQIKSLISMNFNNFLFTAKHIHREW